MRTWIRRHGPGRGRGLARGGDLRVGSRSSSVRGRMFRFRRSTSRLPASVRRRSIRTVPGIGDGGFRRVDRRRPFVAVAHNAMFDLGVARPFAASCPRLFAAPCVCTVALGRGSPGLPSYALDAVTQRQGSVQGAPAPRASGRGSDGGGAVALLEIGAPGERGHALSPCRDNGMMRLSHRPRSRRRGCCSGGCFPRAIWFPWTPMRVIGIDFGERRVGLALGDTEAIAVAVARGPGDVGRRGGRRHRGGREGRAQEALVLGWPRPLGDASPRRRRPSAS